MTPQSFSVLSRLERLKRLDRPPSGTVAHLRRVGLAYVGMRGGKQVMIVPTDLIAPVRALLA